MTTKTTKTLAANTREITQAIWNDASDEYKRRIPRADQGDIADTIKALDQYPTLWNEFTNTLLNRVGLVVMQSNVWKNRLALVKKGMMEYGETIEEVRTGLLEAHRFDPNECSQKPFSCNKVPTATAFHEINRQDQYDFVVNKQMLKRAFLSDSGLEDYITQVMQTAYTSDEYDEYLIMRNLFKEYEQVYGYYKIQVPEVTDILNGQEVESQAKAIAQVIDEYKSLFNFYPTQFNGLGWPTTSEGFRIYVFATPRLASVLRTYVIPFAFKDTSAIDVDIIEVDTFGIPGCQAIMCDERHIMVYDTYMEFEGIRNPRGRSWSYYWNHDGIYSLSYFVNAVMFTTETGTVNPVQPTYTITAVTPVIGEDPNTGETPTFAVKGGAVKMVATVTGTVSPADAKNAEVPQAVMWSLSGSADLPLGQRTYIDSEGWLHVDENEQNTVLTVRATSPYRNALTAENVSGTVEVGVGAVPPEPPDPDEPDEPTNPTGD